MTIREAVLADIPTIRSIAHATWPVVYKEIISPEQITYMLELMYSTAVLNEQFGKGHRFLLAIENATALGFAGYEVRYAGTINTRLHKLYALPGAQGQGVGSALLSSVEAAALAGGDRAIELNVNRFNRSQDFYLRKGFRILRDEVLDIGQGYVMDDHVMVKEL
ncbi:MAG: GNAT family N-acetyltransferase [Flavobacteriales bacterium]